MASDKQLAHNRKISETNNLAIIVSPQVPISNLVRIKASNKTKASVDSLQAMVKRNKTADSIHNSEVKTIKSSILRMELFQTLSHHYMAINNQTEALKVKVATNTKAKFQATKHKLNHWSLPAALHNHHSEPKINK